MKLTGYTDRWSVRPGEQIRCYVSSELPAYQVQLVKLIHGDANPKGPGVKETVIESPVSGEYRGRVQEIYPGSYIRIDDTARLDAGGAFTLAAWIKPTAPQLGRQAIFSQHAGGEGYSLAINESQGLEFSTGEGAQSKIELPERIRTDQWQFICLVVDAKKGEAKLIHRPTKFSPCVEEESAAKGAVHAGISKASGGVMLIGAGRLVDDPSREGALGCFNGKIGEPKLFAGALSGDEIDALFKGGMPKAELIADWDFSFEPAGKKIPNRAGRGFEGRVINRPLRAVNGPKWTGHVHRYFEAPEQYEAIHFHDDDLEDARWEEDFAFTAPSDLKSGVYAFKLTGEDGARDYLPFVVCPPKGKATAQIAVLLPTLSYIAYGNESIAGLEQLSCMTPLQDPQLHADEYSYLKKYSLRSTYDRHNDGSGMAHVSMLRPVLTSFRPYHRCRSFDAPHQFSADLHLIDWLEEKGVSYDVITDHELHREGVDALKPYSAILSGTHAEYWSMAMRDALDEYLAGGGRLIWLSGNGLYWLMELDAETQTVCELRRVTGTSTWQPEPGDGYMAFGGELGGTWDGRGQQTARTIGTKTTGVGFDRGRPYKRTPASNDPRCSFIFDGVGDELIGDFPVLMMNHGVASFEIDRADCLKGTPAHALVVASAGGYSDRYQAPMEDVFPFVPYQSGMFNPNIRADMVFFETPNDGAVFNVGAVSFCTGLSYNNYDNNVSRILENVVRRFSRPGSLTGGK